VVFGTVLVGLEGKSSLGKPEILRQWPSMLSDSVIARGMKKLAL